MFGIPLFYWFNRSQPARLRWVGSGKLVDGTNAKDAVFTDGNVGIGTTGPSEKLVVGTDLGDVGTGNIIVVGDSTAGQIALGVDNSNHGKMLWDNPTKSLQFFTKNAGVLHTDGLVLKEGNVGIGTTAPTEKLEVAGNILASGAITPGSSRDIKRDISDVSTKDAMKAVMGLKPVKFKYKADNSGEEYLGFIAEDVPGLVAMDDRKHLNPMDLTAVFAKVIQEQQKMLQSQQETISALSEKVKILEQRL